MACNGWHLLGAASLALISCSSSQPTLRERLVNAETRATAAEGLLDQAEQEMAALEPGRGGGAVKQGEKNVSDPGPRAYPGKQMVLPRRGAHTRRQPPG